MNQPFYSVACVFTISDYNLQELCDEAESILSASFSEWETILLTSKVLNLVWAQVLPDPFLRRLILR